MIDLSEEQPPVLGEMSFDDYQRLALATAKMYPSLAENLNHAALGLSTEVGEFNTNVKRIVIYEKGMDDKMWEHMKEEIGDLLWYVALACTALGISMETVASMNIQKLKLRYPEKYSNEAAEARADKQGRSAHES